MTGYSARMRIKSMATSPSFRGKPIPPPARPVVSDEWKQWIAENLLIGAAPSSIIERLVKQGCPIEIAQDEVRSATDSPYFKGAEILRRRLAKRDWQLAALARLAALEGPDTLEREPPVTGDAFLRDHYAAHRPILMHGLIDHWPAITRWSLDHFAALLGNPEIEVQTGREANAAYEQQSPKHKARLPLGEVLAMLRADRATNDFYVTANNSSHNRAALAPLWGEIGEIPGLLRPDPNRDGFFWMGPRGTITPWHHDLTNNLLVQIRGRKRVTLVPSMETARMRNHLHCYSDWTSPAAIAALPEAERPRMISCTIAPGEALFIPVGWWHFVEGLDMTMGMSFTNFLWDNDFSSGYTTYDRL